MLGAVDLLLLLALASLPAGGAVVLFAFVSAVSGRPRHRTGILLALAGVVLATVWVVLTCQVGIRADETGTSGSIFSEVGWLLAAVVLSVLSLILSARHRRSDVHAASST